MGVLEYCSVETLEPTNLTHVKKWAVEEHPLLQAMGRHQKPGISLKEIAWLTNMKLPPNQTYDFKCAKLRVDTLVSGNLK
jgi:hypothetical protein